MKKTNIIVTVVLIALISTMLPAMAWSVESVDWNEVEVEFIESNNTPSEWAVPEVDKAANFDIIPQFTDNPEYQDTITREQFAELVVRMMEMTLQGELDIAGTEFSDCSNPMVLKAYAAGVVDGIADGLFDPKSPTNREQIATMLYRAINFLEARRGVDVTPISADVSAFADSSDVSTWAAEGVGTLAANKLMNGTSDTMLSPKLPCTVEQSIALAVRIFELF